MGSAPLKWRERKQDWAKEKVDYDADSAKASASVLNAQTLICLLEVVAHGGEGAGPYTLTTYTSH